MEPKEAGYKGSVVELTRQWLIGKVGGQEAFEQLLETAPEVFREVYGDKNIIPVAWYPAQAYCDLYSVIARRWGQQEFRDGAAWVAMEDLNASMRFFLQIGTPSFVAKSLPNVWGHYFNVGKLAICVDGKFAQCILSGAAAYGLAGCQATMGWSKMALERSGAVNVKVVHYECVHSGAPACVIEYTWD